MNNKGRAVRSVIPLECPVFLVRLSISVCIQTRGMSFNFDRNEIVTLCDITQPKATTTTTKYRRYYYEIMCVTFFSSNDDRILEFDLINLVTLNDQEKG